MTLVAVWRADNQLMAVADTRIVRSAGNILTEHGPKLLPLSIVCKQPGTSGRFDRVVYRSDVGFAYSGSTLSALAAHALSNTLLSKLTGVPDSPPPALNEIAHFVAGASAEYMREVGQLAGNDGLFLAVVFGWCPRQHALRTFELRPVIDGGFRVEVHERILTPIRLAGESDGSVIVIGSAPDLLIDGINSELENARTRGEVHEIVAFDAPKRALHRLIRDGVDERVGGSIQQAEATAAGFQVIANMETIEPRPPSPRNVGLFLLGFDTFALQSVGQYSVASDGR